MGCASSKAVPQCEDHLRPDAPKLYQLLYENPTLSTETWVPLRESTSENSASYCNPTDLTTPLHLLCQKLKVCDQYAICAVRSLVQACPEAVGKDDAHGYLPLHYAIATCTGEGGEMIVRFLIREASENSSEYISQLDVTLDDDPSSSLLQSSNEKVSALYRAVYLDSDGSKAGVIRVLHEACPRKAHESNQINGAWDSPIALLFRRFLKQIYESEKYFPGDNSQEKVVSHRNKHLKIAGTTWKLIECFIAGRKTSQSISLHAVTKLEYCPPALFMFIAKKDADQCMEFDENGCLPLHIAAATSYSSGYYAKFVIELLLKLHPEATRVYNRQSQYPLGIAAESNKDWLSGVKSIYDVYNEATLTFDLSKYPSIEQEIKCSREYQTKSLGRANSFSEEDEITKAVFDVQREDIDPMDIVNIMCSFSDNVAVQVLSILSLLKKSPERPTAIACASGIGAVVNSMQTNQNEAIIQEKGCAVLRNLAASDGKYEISLAAEGAVSAILAAMPVHLSDVNVQLEALNSLQATAMISDEYCILIASVNGIHAICDTMEAHPEDPAVQCLACSTLRTLLTSSALNQATVSKERVISLLKDSSRNFPDECQENASSVLNMFKYV